MADKYRFFNVGKANEEIVRLETLVADRDVALSAAQERITALEATASSPSTELTQARADLTTAKQTISSLEAGAVALQSKLTATEARATAAEKSAPVEAAKIVAACGVPPVTVVPNPTPAAGEPKKNLSHLKGRYRVAAAIRQEMNLPE